jgi:transcriptional regulator with XRE-family HTH domain
MNMNTLGKRIAIAREKLGLNQSELARQLDVTPQAVQKWEMDGSKPRDKAIDLLILALGVSKQWLLLGDESASSLDVHLKPHQIPIVGIAQLGDGGYWEEFEQPSGFIQWYSDDSQAYAVQGNGDSMYPRICNY